MRSSPYSKPNFGRPTQLTSQVRIAQAPTLGDAALGSVRLLGTNSRAADLRSVSSTWADRTKAVCLDADVSRSDLEGVYLLEAKQAGAKISEVNLANAYSREADLSSSLVSTR